MRRSDGDQDHEQRCADMRPDRDRMARRLSMMPAAVRLMVTNVTALVLCVTMPQ